MTKPETDWQHTTQNVDHSLTYANRTFRLKTGLNRQEWETVHNTTMTMKKPSEKHQTTFALKEDGSGVLEKLWLYNHAPMSGFRTVEWSAGSQNRLQTPVLRQCKHVYDGQGMDAFKHIALKTLQDWRQEDVIRNETESLGESIATEVPESCMHPLGYDYEDLPEEFKIQRAEKLQESKFPQLPGPSLLRLSSIQGSPRASPSTHRDVDSPRTCVEDIADDTADNLELGADSFVDLEPEAAAPTIALSLHNSSKNDQDDEMLTIVTTEKGQKPTAKSYTLALDYKIGQKSAKLGNIFHHAQVHLENGKEKSDDMNQLQGIKDNFELCQKFNPRHSAKYSFDNLVNTALALQAKNIELVVEALQTIWQKRAQTLKQEALTDEGDESLFKACAPIRPTTNSMFLACNARAVLTRLSNVYLAL